MGPPVRAPTDQVGVLPRPLPPTAMGAYLDWVLAGASVVGADAGAS